MKVVRVLLLIIILGGLEWSACAGEISQPLEIDCSVGRELPNNFEPIFLEVRFTNSNDREVNLFLQDITFRASVRQSKKEDWLLLRTAYPSCEVDENFCEILVPAKSDTSITLLVHSWNFPSGFSSEEERVFTSGEAYELKIEIRNSNKRQIRKYCESFYLSISNAEFACESILGDLKYPHFMYSSSPLIGVQNPDERHKMTLALSELIRQSDNMNLWNAAQVYDIINRMVLVKSEEDKRQLWRDYMNALNTTQHSYWLSLLSSLKSKLVQWCYPYTE